MHSRKKGKSGSKKPVQKKVPSWQRYQPKEIETLIVKLAKQGNQSSQIGLILRDSYGIPNVKVATSKTIYQIMKDNKLSSKLPEDILNLIKRQIIIMKHLETNKHDVPTQRSLINVDSKIKRLVKYYKKSKVLPADWKYNKDQAKRLIY